MRNGIINNRTRQVKRKTTLFIALRSLFVDELRTINYKLILVLLFITLLRSRPAGSGPVFAFQSGTLFPETFLSAGRSPGLAGIIFNSPYKSGRLACPGMIFPHNPTPSACLHKQTEGAENKPPQATDRIQIDPSTQLRVDWLDILINQIWMVESGGPRTYLRQGDAGIPNGDNGKAIGPLQIHQCVLDDVNRHYGTRFTCADMRDIDKAKIVARLYIEMWAATAVSQGETKMRGSGKSREEIAARIFNGGPRGWNSASTDEYWRKVKEQISKSKDTEQNKEQANKQI